MRVKKLEKYINKIIDDKVGDLKSADIWNRLLSFTRKVEQLEKKVVELKMVVDTLWNLPQLKQYRSKK
jgi:hypothetical protein